MCLEPEDNLVCRLPKSPKKPKNHEHQGTAKVLDQILKVGRFYDTPGDHHNIMTWKLQNISEVLFVF